MKRTIKAAALLLLIVMLLSSFAGAASSQPNNGTAYSGDAVAGPMLSSSANENEPMKSDQGTVCVYDEETEGVQLYAYRSWSEAEHRDYVAFMSDDAGDAASLWPYPGGMLAAEYVNGVLYAVDDNLALHAIDPLNGAATQVAVFEYIVYDMTFDYISQTMFCIAYNYSEPSRKLARIDLSTGELFVMGEFTINADMIALTAGRTPGVLYGIDDAGEMYRIDPYGNCEPFASTGFTGNYDSTMTYCYENDSIYWAHNPGAELVKLDPVTGGCKVVGTLPDHAYLTGLTSRPDPADLPDPIPGGSATDINLNTQTILLAPGVEKQLFADIIPFNALNTDVTWNSGDASIVTVDENGVIKGVTPGETVVTVTAADGGHTDTCLVTVVETPVSLMGFRLYSTDGGYGDYLSFTDVNPESIASNWSASFEMYSSEYCNGQLYTCDWSNSQFSSVNLETGELTPIGDCAYSFLAMSYDYESQTMFALAFGDQGQFICAVDLDTAQITNVCNIRGAMSFLTFSAARDGNFYAIDGNGDLYIIDDYGYPEIVGPTGYTSVHGMQSMTYDYFNDCLYWAYFPGGELVRVNPENAETMSLGLIGKGAQITALTVLRDEAYTPSPSEAFPATGIKVTPETFTIAPGITKTFCALVYPWNADDKTVAWSSGDESIATVDQNGRVTGISPGDVFITAKANDGGFTSSAMVTVRENGVELRGSRVFSQDAYSDYIRIYDYEPSNVESMWVPKSMIYAADYYDGTLYAYAQNTGLLFATDPETGAGRVIGACYYEIFEMAFDYTTNTMYCIALKDGAKHMARIDLNTAEITITGRFDSLEQLLTLSGGRDGMFHGIDFLGNFYRIDAQGHCTLIGNTGYTANYLQSMTYDYATDSIYWAQYPDGRLVKIDPETGSGTSLGLIDSAPEVGGLYALCDEEYLPEFIDGVAVTGVSISQDEIKLIPSGDKLLAAVIEPFNAENREVVWSSSNEGVATVDENGFVTAISVGEATITAATLDGGFTAAAHVNVVETGAEFYAYRNNGNDKFNDWVKLTDTATDSLTSLWDAQQEIYAAEYLDGCLYAAYRFDCLIKADIETGEYTVVGYPQAGYQLWGMTYDYVRETMYALVYEEATNTNLLGRLDITTAQVEILGGFDSDSPVQMIAAARDGLYAMDEGGNLLRVDDSGACELVVSTGVLIPFIQSLTYDYERDTFIWTQNCWGFNQDCYLMSLDPMTGERELLGIIGAGGNQPILTGLVTVPDEQDLPTQPTPTPTNAPTPTPTIAPTPTPTIAPTPTPTIAPTPTNAPTPTGTPAPADAPAEPTPAPDPTSPKAGGIALAATAALAIASGACLLLLKKNRR